ncbi:MAG: class I SAM-dependent methyltransferase [Anaerolineae bacterium]
MTNPLDDPLYHSTRRTWESIWQQADVAAEVATMQYPRAVETFNAYLPYLPKDAWILEAGSGQGAVLVALQARGYRVIGLDYAFNALAASQAYEPSLCLQNGDVHALPYADNSLGAYLSFGVLEHFPHGMRPALAEAYRVLRRGGVLVMTIPYPNVIWKLAQRRREARGRQRIDDDFYESTYTREELVAACTSVGFDVVKAIPTSHSFTLWGAHPIFRAPGYYRTSALAELAGRALRVLAPWPFNFMTLIIARK